MTTQPLPVSSTVHQRIKRPAFTALAALAMASLGACAGGPAPTQTQATSAAATVTQPVTHNCQPKETVAFSCELHDHQLVSLCVSSEFMAYRGEPKDNPGYAYLALGSRKGDVQFRYPQDPKDYKQHMTFSMSLAGAWPHMFVNTDKGRFLHFSLDVEEPADANPENAPRGWPSGAFGGQPLCAGPANRDHLDSVMSKMIDDPEWVKIRGRGR